MDRDAPRNREQILPTFLTFITSALWHGIFSGFYLFFVSIAFLSLFCKTFMRTEISYQLDALVPWPIKWFICYYLIHIVIAYFGMAFMLLFVEEYNPMYESMGYFFHWTLPLATVIAFFLPMHKKDKVNPDKKQA